MASYNKIDGTYATENNYYLRDVLHGEWNYQGMVVSDWAAVHDRVAVVRGGCALTMPGDKVHDTEIIEAVEAGRLSMEDLDEAAGQGVELALKIQSHRNPDATYDFEEAHSFAREVAEQSIVLLKNDHAVLPLNDNSSVALIGAFAEETRYQGAGSSRVMPYKVSNLKDIFADNANVTFARGFQLINDIDEELMQAAVELAAKSEIAVIVAGYPSVMESEGFDKFIMKLPVAQNLLIEKVASVNKNTIVVLQNGGAVEMPWADKVAGIVEAYLGGEAAAEAIANVLTGKVNPSGHLAESFPVHMEDNPSYLFFPGEGDTVTYPEGVFVGYRYYTTKKVKTLFPFGYGLSYTTFSYSNLNYNLEDRVAKVTITNTGDRAGAGLVQLYIGSSKRACGYNRPVRELKRFEKVYLQPGESKEVEFALDDRCFAIFDEEVDTFRIPGGKYTVEICTDADTVVLSKEIDVINQYIPTGKTFDLMSSVGDVMKHSVGKEFLDAYMPKVNAIIARMGMNSAAKQMPYFEQMPLDQMGLYTEPMQTIKRMLPDIPQEQWDELFAKMNE